MAGNEKMNYADAIAESNRLIGRGGKRRSPEADEQALLFAWKERNVEEHPELKWLHSSGNGYNLSTPASRAQANRTGRVKGVWDVFLPAPDRERTTGGLYIEMKAKGGKLTVEQEAFREGCRCHFSWAVCYSAEEAQAAICEHLRIEITEITKEK